MEVGSFAAYLPRAEARGLPYAMLRPVACAISNWACDWRVGYTSLLVFSVAAEF